MLGQVQGSTSVLHANTRFTQQIACRSLSLLYLSFTQSSLKKTRNTRHLFEGRYKARGPGERPNTLLQGEGGFKMRFVVAIVVLMAVLAGFGMAGIQVAGDNLPGGNAALPGLIRLGGDNLPGGD